jgi:hypothetical protein
LKLLLRQFDVLVPCEVADWRTNAFREYAEVMKVETGSFSEATYILLMVSEEERYLELEAAYLARVG